MKNTSISATAKAANEALKANKAEAKAAKKVKATTPIETPVLAPVIETPEESKDPEACKAIWFCSH